jgi:hypothetical protein
MLASPANVAVFARQYRDGHDLVQACARLERTGKVHIRCRRTNKVHRIKYAPNMHFFGATPDFAMPAL